MKVLFDERVCRNRVLDKDSLGLVLFETYLSFTTSFNEVLYFFLQLTLILPYIVYALTCTYKFVVF